MIKVLLLLSVAFAANAPIPTAGPSDSLFRAFEPEIESIAVDIRASGVSPSEASSVASVIASEGLMPSQVTQMAKLAKTILANEHSINAQSLLEVATIMASAYTSIHTQSSYSSYVNYVKQHFSIFDFQKVRSLAGSGAQVPRMGEAQLLSMYESLMINSNGRNAIHTLTNVMESYARDFNIGSRGVWISQLLYNMV